MTAVLQGFWLISVAIGAGWVLAHAGLVDRAGQQAIARLTFWVGTPALLLLVVHRADPAVIFSGFLVATAAAVGTVSVAYLLLARLVLHRSWTHALMGGMSVSYVNSNNLGVPIAIYVLGDAGWAAPVILMQLLVLQPLWLALMDAGGAGAFSLRRALRSPLTNPLTLASVVGLLLSLAHVDLPRAVEAPLELLGGLAVPGMLVAFGISLRLSPLPGGRDNLLELAAVVALKLLAMPAVAWLVAGPVLHLDAQHVLAAVVMATLPTAQNVYLLALTYGRGETVARDAVFTTTVLALPAMLLVVSLL